jgi:radical SAM protein with 4Fe4S-binding SPASM domain
LLIDVFYDLKLINVPAYPIRLDIESTSYCNLDCRMCPRSKMKRKDMHMDFELFRSIIDPLAPYLSSVSLHLFGEPLMAPDFLKMVTYCNGLGIKTEASTNATLLDEKMAVSLINSGLDMLTISLDGASKETYEYIRRNSDYDIVVKHVHDFLRIKNSWDGPAVRLQCIKMKETEAEITAFKALWQDVLGENDKLFIKPVDSYADESIECFITDSEPLHYLDYPCPMPWHMMTVYADGRVVPCCKDYSGKNVLGDVNKKTITEIWNDKPIQELRRKIRSLDYESVKLCSRCKMHESERCNLGIKSTLQKFY